jgi:hypothetical protein
MTKRPLCLAIGLYLALGSIIFCAPARSDQLTPMVRTLCMPEDGLEHFSAWVQSYNGFDVKGNIDEHRDVLRKYGLSPAYKYEIKCPLPKAEYSIFGERPYLKAQGECGGNPRAKLSFKSNAALLIDDVFFEKSCFADDASPFVKQVGVTETLQTFGVHLDLTISDGQTDRSLRFPIAKMTSALTQSDLNCLVKEGYFKPKIDRKAEGCLHVLSPKQ